MKRGTLFYITGIDQPQKLELFYEKYRDKFYCVYQREIYTGEQWLEVMPSNDEDGVAGWLEQDLCIYSK